MNHVALSKTIGFVATLNIAILGCDFTSFDTYRQHASIVSFPQPVGFAHDNYGANIAVAGDDHALDWLAVSGGLGTSIVATPLRQADVFDPGTPSPRFLCDTHDTCVASNHNGVGLAGLSSWSGANICIMTGSFGTIDQVHVGCIGSDITQAFEILPPPGLETSGFGISLATPRRRTALDPSETDLVFIGAPGGSGHVFAAQPAGVTDVTPPNVIASGTLGDALALGRIRSGGVTDLLLVAAGLGASEVQVMRGDPRASRPMQPVGCIVRPEEPGFGGALAVGDLDGDGSDEIIVGSLDSAQGRHQTVHVFSIANAPAHVGCDGSTWTDSVAIDCADDPTHGVKCAGINADFGASLASGDLDGDGRDELMIGASRATVDGFELAGAIWIYGSTGSLSNIVRLNTLRDSVAAGSAKLGSSLAMVLLDRREELLASVMGQNAVRLFLCTGIPGDMPGSMGLNEECR